MHILNCLFNPCPKPVIHLKQENRQDKKVSSLFSNFAQSVKRFFFCANIPNEVIPLKEFPKQEKSKYLNLLEKNTILLSRDLSVGEVDAIRDIYETLGKSENLDVINKYVQILTQHKRQLLKEAREKGSFVKKEIQLSKNQSIKLLRPIFVTRTSIEPIYKKHKPGIENERKKGKDQPKGKGAEGVVWATGAKYAVKRILYKDRDPEEILNAIQDLKREAMYLKKMYPDLEIEYVEYEGKHGPRALLRMPKMDQDFEIESEREDLSPDQVLEYIQQIAEMLTSLKQKSIVHRDLKPKNILMKDQKLFLFDYGLADKESPEGSPLYLTPESIEVLFRDQDEKEMPAFSMDMYAAGMVLISLIYQTHPFFEIMNLPHENFLKVSYLTFKGFQKTKNQESWVDEKLKLTEKQSNRAIQQLIKKMVHLDPKKRLSPEEMIAFFNAHKQQIRGEIVEIKEELTQARQAILEKQLLKKANRAKEEALSDDESDDELGDTTVINS